MKIWSELPRAQAREMVADLATLVWVGLWGFVAWQIYSVLASFAEAGRAIREGGRNLGSAGDELGRALQNVPVVGGGASDALRDSFTEAGQPFVQMGTELEGFVLAAATVLSLIILALPLIPWLNRYLPWRLERLRTVRSANYVIRRAPDLSRPQVERILASRALHRLSYESLMEYSDDPFGDWVTGRHDRLARAELAAVGLRPRW